jgi:2-polyprenyl-6-methoxyphenol hydroxylase-like FAD-dependent oxidoreductase
LYGWLRERVGATFGIQLEEGRIVAEVQDLGDRALLVFDDGTQEVVAAAIGADGYRSVVRRAVAPEAPFARFAGYLVWRGLVEEAALKQPVPWPSNGGLWIDFLSGYRLVAGVLPGREGSVEIGHRQITFAWFDAYREQLLRRAGCLSPEGYVVGTLAASAIAAHTRAELSALVPRLWHSPWTEAVQVGVGTASSLSGATIAEYMPNGLARGALAIVGDAAHSVSPMTGRGFASGVEDALLLARLLSARPVQETVSTVFARYERERLPLVRSLVSTSQRLSAELVRYAAEFQA